MLADPRFLVRRPVASLVTHWPLALADDVEGIHQTRVASRRLREWVPVLAPDARVGAPARVRGGLRDVTRLFGPSRELDVSRVLLDAIASRTPAHAAAVSAVRAHVERERAKAGRARRRASRAVDIERLAAEVRALAGPGRAPGFVEACAARAAARLDRRARQVRERLVAAGFVYAPGPLHQVRIALKRFRYALEAAGKMGRFTLRGTLRRVKAMQDVLGDVHDLQVLSGHARDAMALAPASKRAAIEALVAGVDGTVRAQHGRFVAGRDSLVEVLGRAARVSAALLEMRALDGPRRDDGERKRRRGRRKGR